MEMNDLEYKIVSSQFFLCLWTRNSTRDERQHQQIDIAIRLKKPIILAIEKSAVFPDFIREEANIVHEFEWEHDKLDKMATNIMAFLTSKDIEKWV